MKLPDDNYKKKLQDRLKRHLKRGDRSEIARKHNVDRSRVTTVINNMEFEHPIMADLIEKAEANKKAVKAITTKISKI